MAKQGQKLDDELKERIIAALVVTDNKNEVAKSLGVSWATVNKIAKEIAKEPEEKEEFEKLREQKRIKLIDKIWLNMEDAIELGHMKIKLAKESTEKVEELIEKLMNSRELDMQQVMELSKSLSAATSIPLSHISTYFGTLWDKQALMQGQNTSSMGVNGGLNNTTQDLTGLSSEERRARIDELNRRRGNGATGAS